MDIIKSNEPFTGIHKADSSILPVIVCSGLIIADLRVIFLIRLMIITE